MTNDIVKSEPLQIFLRRAEVVEKFIGLFPNDRAANRFIQSVLILVQTSDPGDYSLQSCSNESILRSALRAASLRVSVDPAVRQAWLIPRKNRKTGKIEANLQLHYAEVRNRAMRTGRYAHISVTPIYDGEQILENPFTGLYRLQLPGGLIIDPADQAGGYIPANQRGNGKVAGWLGYMETFKHVKNMVYWTIGDIEKHAGKYNPYWQSSKAWKENREAMEKKTVLLDLLRKYADLGDDVMGEVSDILEAETEEMDALPGTVEENAAALDTVLAAGVESEYEIDEAEARYKDALEVTTPKGSRLADLNHEQLLACTLSKNEQIASAAKIILDYRAALNGKGKDAIDELFPQ